MEATSCIRAVVSASTQYRNNSSDANLTQLLRQLDVLISVTAKASALRMFDSTQLLPTECITCLIDCLNDVQVKATLAEKILILFSNLANDSTIRKVLFHTYHLAPCLASFLTKSVKSYADPNALLCVRLLQRITYNTKIHSHENFVDELLKFLIRQIKGKETELLQPSLGLFANLCRQNYSMQTYIKHMDNVNSLYKALMSLLSQQNHVLTVFALAILASLCINDDLGESLFNAGNINNTFQLMFNVLVKGDKGVTRRYTVDLFLDLLRHSKVEHSLTIYPNLELCLNQVLVLICDKDFESVSKVIELLLALCGVSGVSPLVSRCVLESPSLASSTPPPASPTDTSSISITEPFYAAVHWASRPTDVAEDTPILSLQFLKEIYQELIDQGLVNRVPARLETVLPQLVETLMSATKIQEIPPSPRQCLKVSHTFQLLLTLCNDDSLQEMVSHSVDAKTCTDLLDWQFAINPLANGVHNNAASEEQWRAGVELVLYTLDFMHRTAKSIPNMGVHLSNALQNPCVVGFLAAGVVSSVRELVQISLRLINKGASMPSFQTTVLGDSIAALNSHAALELSSSSHHTAYSHEDKENLPPTFKSSLNKPKMTDRQLEQSVSNIIEKMHNGFELKDVRTSEMISVYEHRLQSLETKENHLQDLLEAKSLALEQADRLIAQYRSRRAQADAESHRLRSIVGECERRCEEYRDKLNESMLERERMTNDLEQQAQDLARLEVIAEDHKELTQAYTEQTQKLENTQRTLTSLKQEYNTIREMHEMLTRHNETLKQQHDVASQQLSELEEERKNLSRQLKDKEQKVSELSKNLKKAEDRLKKIEKDRNQLEVATDKLRENLATTEGRKKELQHQVNSLELVCRQHEASIKEKDELIKTQKTDIDKHAQVAALIRNLTSGMTPEELAGAK